MREELRKFIVDNFLFGAGHTQFSDNDSFLEKGFIDSTGVLELVAFLEERYAIKVGDHELIPENLDSINGLMRFISGKQLPAVAEGKLAS